MKTTHHCQSRQNQRGITQAMIDIVLAFGEPSGDKIMLTKKQAIRLYHEIDFLLKSHQPRR